MIAHLAAVVLATAPADWDSSSADFELSAVWVSGVGPGVRLGGSVELGRVADVVGLGLRFGGQPTFGFAWSAPPGRLPPYFWLAGYLDFEARYDFNANLGVRAALGVMPSLEVLPGFWDTIPDGTYRASRHTLGAGIGGDAMVSLRFRSDDMGSSGVLGVGVYLGTTGLLGLITLGVLW